METSSLPHAGLEAWLERLAQRVTRWVSGSHGFVLAVGIILAWLIAGPFAHWSETWQLVINTSTTIITFVMVFLIQRSQSKESLALQLKLDEVVAALAGASNDLVKVEELSESDLAKLNERYRKLKEQAGKVRAGAVLSVDARPARSRKRRGRQRL
jgi:low affinity Fe/Cu permease